MGHSWGLSSKMPQYRKGPPSCTELAHVRGRLAQGEDLETIAASLSRKPETLARNLNLHRAEVHPTKVNPALVVTTRSGARIEGLSLHELLRLARAL